VTAARWWPAYIGVGSNLDSPVDQVEQGISALDSHPDAMVVLKSSLYRSAPLGPADQPDFINAVVGLLTTLDARALLSTLQSIETLQGRTRTGERWGPRSLDLDLLSYADLVVDDAELTLPHPGIAERNFVLLPWAAITPAYPVPGLATVEVLAGRVSQEPRIERIA
jgi:2-amino-4-hydroxy-6-hydroxymethyldihydropteridine diphosphokinase